MPTGRNYSYKTQHLCSDGTCRRTVQSNPGDPVIRDVDVPSPHKLISSMC